MEENIKESLKMVSDQLISLRENSESMISDNDDEDCGNEIWKNDVVQLDIAINLIEILKYQANNIEECLKLLKIDGKNTKEVVKIMLETCNDDFVTFFNGKHPL